MLWPNSIRHTLSPEGFDKYLHSQVHYSKRFCYYELSQSSTFSFYFVFSRAAETYVLPPVSHYSIAWAGRRPAFGVRVFTVGYYSMTVWIRTFILTCWAISHDLYRPLTSSPWGGEILWQLHLNPFLLGEARDQKMAIPSTPRAYWQSTYFPVTNLIFRVVYSCSYSSRDQLFHFDLNQWTFS